MCSRAGSLTRYVLAWVKGGQKRLFVTFCYPLPSLIRATAKADWRQEAALRFTRTVNLSAASTTKLENGVKPTVRRRQVWKTKDAREGEVVTCTASACQSIVLSLFRHIPIYLKLLRLPKFFDPGKRVSRTLHFHDSRTSLLQLLLRLFPTGEWSR